MCDFFVAFVMIVYLAGCVSNQPVPGKPQSEHRVKTQKAETNEGLTFSEYFEKRQESKRHHDTCGFEVKPAFDYPEKMSMSDEEIRKLLVGKWTTNQSVARHIETIKDGKVIETEFTPVLAIMESTYVFNSDGTLSDIFIIKGDENKEDSQDRIIETKGVWEVQDGVVKMSFEKDGNLTPTNIRITYVCIDENTIIEIQNINDVNKIFAETRKKNSNDKCQLSISKYYDEDGNSYENITTIVTGSPLVTKDIIKNEKRLLKRVP